jgi:hypothetical protein
VVKQRATTGCVGMAGFLASCRFLAFCTSYIQTVCQYVVR